MGSTSADNTYVVPKARTIRLPAALAVGATAVVLAFGAGYTAAEQLEEPAVSTTAASARESHVSRAALTESLVLKQRHAARSSVAAEKARDIRYSRVR